MKITVEFENIDDFNIKFYDAISNMLGTVPMPCYDKDSELKSVIFESLRKIKESSFDENFPRFNLINCFVKGVTADMLKEHRMTIELGYDVCQDCRKS